MSFLRTAYALAQGISSGLNLVLVADSLVSEPMSLPARIVIGAVGAVIDAAITYHFQGTFLSEDGSKGVSASCPEVNAGLVIAGIAAFLVDGILSQATGLSAYREKLTGKTAVPTVTMGERGQKITRGASTGLHTSSHVVKILTVMPGAWASKHPSVFVGLMTAACLVYLAGIGTTT